MYRAEPALHERDFEPGGFEWIEANDAGRSLLAFLRRGHAEEAVVVVAANYTPVPRHNVRVGVPRSGVWSELLNSDATTYGGSGQGNLGRVRTAPIPMHGRPVSLNLTVPPLGVIMLRWERP